MKKDFKCSNPCCWGRTPFTKVCYVHCMPGDVEDCEDLREYKRLIERVNKYNGDDQMRGYGRTTGTILTAIGEALREPGTIVTFGDHHGNTPRNAHIIISDVERIVALLGLHEVVVSTYLKDNRVSIVSNYYGKDIK